MENQVISILKKNVNFCAKIWLKYLYFCIHWSISTYTLFLKFLQDFANENIWLAVQIWRNKTQNNLSYLFSPRLLKYIFNQLES